MLLSTDIDYIHDMHAIAREYVQDVAGEYLERAENATNVRDVLTALRYAYLDVGHALRIVNDTTDTLAE